MQREKLSRLFQCRKLVARVPQCRPRRLTAELWIRTISTMVERAASWTPTASKQCFAPLRSLVRDAEHWSRPWVVHSVMFWGHPGLKRPRPRRNVPPARSASRESARRRSLTGPAVLGAHARADSASPSHRSAPGRTAARSSPNARAAAATVSALLPRAANHSAATSW